MDESTSLSITKRPPFTEVDDGLASLADMEAGSSGNHSLIMKSSRFKASNRSDSYRVLSSSTAWTRSTRVFDTKCEDHQPHFLESCFLCKKPLGENRDIFMYRGDIPFCSEECREEQIEIDEEKEKNMILSGSWKTLRNDQKKSNSTPNKTQNSPVRAGTVAAA